MSLTTVLILIALALAVFGQCLWAPARRLRNPLLLVISVGVIFWLQPSLPIRGLDFWLPLATLSLTSLGWVLTSNPVERNLKGTLVSGALIAGTALLIALTRFVSFKGLLTPSRPPQTSVVLLVLAGLILVFLVGYWLTTKGKAQTGRFGTTSYVVGIVILLMVFAALKLPRLASLTSTLLRGWSGQSPALASALDLRWLGFSYVAFRLIHTLRDRQSGRLPAMARDEYFI